LGHFLADGCNYGYYGRAAFAIHYFGSFGVAVALLEGVHYSATPLLPMPRLFKT
jgi:hypothetical protein